MKTMKKSIPIKAKMTSKSMVLMMKKRKRKKKRKRRMRCLKTWRIWSKASSRSGL